MRNLLKNPAWQRDDLGQALPDSKHAVSVAMPLLEHVHGYEKGNPEVLGKLKLGYPRFLIHSDVQEYFDQALEQLGKEGEDCFCFPSLGAAKRAEQFVSRRVGKSVNSFRTQNLADSVVALLFPEEFKEQVKEYWQHAGEVVSSRQVEKQKSLPQPNEVKKSRQVLEQRVGNYFQGSQPARVHISPSGMASFFYALRLVTTEFTKSRVVQIGFPYVDSLKLLEKCCDQHHLFPKIGTVDYDDAKDYDDFEKLCLAKEVDAVFVEFPTNASLSVSDLERISKICRQAEVPLVVDDTIGSFLNLDLSKTADVVVSSLTKYFSGAGDVLAGSLVLCPESPFFENFSGKLEEMDKCDLYDKDLIKLEKNSSSYQENLSEMQENAFQLAQFLKSHPAVKRVLYPGLGGKSEYDNLRRSEGGYGALLSIELEGSPEKFFDRLPFSKGPSLGTVFTLACPYTLLAHYNELDWAESCGVSANLIRVSVGKEDYQVLENGFSKALS